MKSLLIMTALTLSISAFAKELSEPALTKHFSFHKAEHSKMKKEGRKPAENTDATNEMATKAEQDEQLSILKDFKKHGTYFQVLETIGQFKEKGGTPDKEKIAAQIPALMAKKLADKKSLTYKAIRYRQISMIDGRNSAENIIDYPIKSETIRAFGPIDVSVSQRERCTENEKNPKQYSCSSGWASWSYLTTVEMSGCHNSGCDTLPLVYRVSISYVPAVYDGSNMEENAKPKMIQGASYQVQVEEVVNIQAQIQPGERE